MFPIGVFIPLDPLHFLLLEQDEIVITPIRINNRLSIFSFFIRYPLFVYKASITKYVLINYFRQAKYCSMVFSNPKYRASQIKACPIETSKSAGILFLK